MLVHTYNPSVWKAKASSKPGLESMVYLKINKERKRTKVWGAGGREHSFSLVLGKGGHGVS